MKRKLMIIRFGSPIPLEKEQPIIRKLTNDGETPAIGCSTDFGVVSLVYTSIEPKAVVELFNEVANETGDYLPSVVIDLESTTGVNLVGPWFTKVAEALHYFEEAISSLKIECTLSLDELLDLVHQRGVNGLTDAELKRLKELSK
jgi:hypothetical protein